MVFVLPIGSREKDLAVHPIAEIAASYDLCVIGAGMCGVSTARAAADVGLSVILFDAHSIGHGATGKSAGHVMTGFLPSMSSSSPS